MDRLDPKTSAILIVDVQEKLASAMPPAQMTDLLRATSILLEASEALGPKVIATEQYPRGLGPTVSEVRERLQRIGAPILEKLEFSAAEAPAFSAAWQNTGARSAVVIGMEAHVCVYQTVRELCARGVRVLVPIDGVASRRDDHRQAGLALCAAEGATITTTETIVFDWLRRAGTEEFKRLSKVIR